MKEFLSDAQIDEIEQFGLEAPSQIIAHSVDGEAIDLDFNLFSIPDLIDLLPEEINGGRLVIYRMENGGWGVYFNYANAEVFKGEELIDALFELVKECISNNKISQNNGE